MTALQRRLLEKFADADGLPLQKAIAAALEEIRRLEGLANCPSCKGAGKRWYALAGMMPCEECKGTGRRR